MQVLFASRKSKPWLYIVFSQFYNSQNFLEDPGKARGCSTINPVTDLLIHSLTQSSLMKISLRRHYALTVEDDAFSQTQTMLQFFWDYNSLRASESPYWFNIYGNLAEWVDCQYWLSLGSGGCAINGANPSSFQLL